MKLASFVVMVACALARVANGEEVEWANTEQTTNLWRVCSLKDIYTLKLLVEEDPSLVTVRSEDGRGPLFWAHEYGFTEGIELLESLGADVHAVDIHGKSLSDMAEERAAEQKLNADLDEDMLTNFFDDDEEDFFD